MEKTLGIGIDAARNHSTPSPLFLRNPSVASLLACQVNNINKTQISKLKKLSIKSHQYS